MHVFLLVEENGFERFQKASYPCSTLDRTWEKSFIILTFEYNLSAVSLSVYIFGINVYV